MIHIENVSYAYPGGEPVLTDVCADIPGGITVLAGYNGSGKSTLLALLAGLFEPTSGRVRLCAESVDGADNADSSDGVASPDLPLRESARLMHQDADLQILGSTVGEDMLLGRDLGDPDVEASCRERLRSFGLEHHWDTPVQTLSWGSKRKLCLAAALADHPHVLLLDEPFSGLDYPGMREMRRYLQENRDKGLIQIVSSHDLDPIADLADQLALMDGGRLVCFGSVSEVLPHVEEHGVRPPCSWKAGLGIAPWE